LDPADFTRPDKVAKTWPQDEATGTAITLPNFDLMSDKRSGCRGCFVWFLCLAGVMVVVMGIAAYFGWRQLVAFREQFTDTKPLALPRVSPSQQELAAIHKRVDQFLDDARAGHTNAQLSLSGSDLNALLSASVFSNRVFVTLTNDALLARFSVPLDELGWRFLHGRYLNGSGTLNVGCVSGVLSVTVQQLSVNGLALPEHYQNAIRGRNFAEGIATNIVTRESLDHIRQVVIRGERLVLESVPLTSPPSH
jgi:hypothetical protein